MHTARQDIEAEICAIFESLLEIGPGFDRSQSFIELGGQSILMIKLQMEIAKRLSAKIPFADLYRFGTVHQLTDKIHEERENKRLSKSIRGN